MQPSSRSSRTYYKINHSKRLIAKRYLAWTETQMGIDPEITKRIHELGGMTPSDDSSLKEYLLRTTFPHYLYPKDWDLYGVDSFLEDNRNLFDSNRDSFLDRLERHYFTKHDFACGQDFWQPTLFTPLTPGTKDFVEWKSWFTDYADLTPVRSLCGDAPLEFVQIIHSYGYPDHYYICINDPRPENPTVFGTDHEEFFQGISARESLLDFFNSYCTRSEFRKMVTTHLSGRR